MAAWISSLLTLLLLLYPYYTTASPISSVSRSLMSPASSISSAIKAGYWPAWNNLTFPASAINFPYFTHILYAFVQPDSSTFALDITLDDEPLLAKFTTTLHCQTPPIKAILSVGGGSSRAQFADLVGTHAKRSTFIASTIAVARRFGFDGVDLDWEFPADAYQMTNLSYLFTEWRLAVEYEAAETGHPCLLLSAAVYFSPHFFLSEVNQWYPVPAMVAALDWVSPMCFDYHGKWNTSVTGEHAALYDHQSNLNTAYGLQAWLASGMPAGKLVMGVPLYGRTWQLADARNNGVGAAGVGIGPGSKEGTMEYGAVVEWNKVKNATVVVDVEGTGSVYSYAGTEWIGYEDPVTVARKVEFAKGLGLGGYFFWALGYDSEWSISKRASTTWDG